MNRTWRSWPNHSQGSCEWFDCDLEVLWVELKKILHFKVGCSDFGPVRDRGSLPYPTILSTATSRHVPTYLYRIHRTTIHVDQSQGRTDTRPYNTDTDTGIAPSIGGRSGEGAWRQMLNAAKCYHIFAYGLCSFTCWMWGWMWGS